MQKLHVHLYIENHKLLPIHHKMVWARTVVITSDLSRALFVRCFYIFIQNVCKCCNIICASVLMSQYKVNGFVSFRVAIDV